MTTTPNLNLNVPDYGDQNWDVPINENWLLLDTAIAGKQATLTFDSAPISGSTNPVTSGGIYTALSAKANDSTVVKLTGNQTVAGEKTFTSQVYYNRPNDARIRTIAPNLTNGTTPSATQWTGIDLQDKNNVEMAQQLAYVDTNNIAVSAQWVRIPGTTTTSFGVQTFGNPTTNTIETHALTPATSDSSTKIATTANVDAKITAQAVKLSGNQTIAGTKTFSSSPILPTPATSDNSTKGATTAYVVNVLKAIYPVGAVYIGTTSTCPLASFFGTWTLKSSGIVTSVNTNVPVKGNGITLGLTNGTDNYGLQSNTGNYSERLSASGGSYGVSAGSTRVNTNLSNGETLGITTDASKSGIVGTVTRSTYTVNIWERTA